MKKLPLFFLLLSCLTGCFSAPSAKPHYRVGLQEACTQPIEFPQFKTFKLVLADDLQAMVAPYVLHADGRVSLYTNLTYYAPLPIAVERAIQDCITPTPSLGKVHQLKLTLTDYAIDLRNSTPTVLVGIKSNVALLPQTDGSQTLQEKIPTGLQRPITTRVELPTPYTVEDVRQAFAHALLTLCDALY